MYMSGAGHQQCCRGKAVFEGIADGESHRAERLLEPLPLPTQFPDCALHWRSRNEKLSSVREGCRLFSICLRSRLGLGISAGLCCKSCNWITHNVQTDTSITQSPKHSGDGDSDAATQTTLVHVMLGIGFAPKCRMRLAELST